MFHSEDIQRDTLEICICLQIFITLTYTTAIAVCASLPITCLYDDVIDKLMISIKNESDLKDNFIILILVVNCNNKGRYIS